MKPESKEQKILFDSQSPKCSKRMALSVLLLEENIDLESISHVVGVSTRQIRNYRSAYERSGSAALTQNTHYKPVSELHYHEGIIRENLVSFPVATAAEAAQRIEELTGIKRSPTQVRKFMHDLGLKPLKAAAIPAKADPDVQSEFLETELEPRIKEAKNGERALLYVDAAHFVWQLYLGVLWCITRIFIPAASGRTRINVLGAYDPIMNRLIKIVNRDYINSETVMELLENIRAVYMGCKITVVLDNARYQRCKAVMEKAASLGIELLYLPTYSPNLNLIERLWRFIKKDCLYSKYYPTANEFESAILNSLESINTTNKHKLESLMTLKFQLFSKLTIPNDDQRIPLAA